MRLKRCKVFLSKLNRVARFKTAIGKKRNKRESAMCIISFTNKFQCIHSIISRNTFKRLNRVKKYFSNILFIKFKVCLRSKPYFIVISRKKFFWISWPKIRIISSQRKRFFRVYSSNILLTLIKRYTIAKWASKFRPFTTNYYKYVNTRCMPKKFLFLSIIKPKLEILARFLQANSDYYYSISSRILFDCVDSATILHRNRSISAPNAKVKEVSALIFAYQDLCYHYFRNFRKRYLFWEAVLFYTQKLPPLTYLKFRIETSWFFIFNTSLVSLHLFYFRLEFIEKRQKKFFKKMKRILKQLLIINIDKNLNRRGWRKTFYNKKSNIGRYIYNKLTRIYPQVVDLSVISFVCVYVIFYFILFIFKVVIQQHNCIIRASSDRCKNFRMLCLFLFIRFIDWLFILFLIKIFL